MERVHWHNSETYTFLRISKKNRFAANSPHWSVIEPTKLVIYFLSFTVRIVTQEVEVGLSLAPRCLLLGNSSILTMATHFQYPLVVGFTLLRGGIVSMLGTFLLAWTTRT
jgi:hypothetical protein